MLLFMKTVSISSVTVNYTRLGFLFLAQWRIMKSAERRCCVVPTRFHKGNASATQRRDVVQTFKSRLLRRLTLCCSDGNIHMFSVYVELKSNINYCFRYFRVREITIVSSKSSDGVSAPWSAFWCSPFSDNVKKVSQRPSRRNLCYMWCMQSFDPNCAEWPRLDL